MSERIWEKHEIQMWLSVLQTLSIVAPCSVCGARLLMHWEKFEKAYELEKANDAFDSEVDMIIGRGIGVAYPLWQKTLPEEYKCFECHDVSPELEQSNLRYWSAMARNYAKKCREKNKKT